jgi:predicted  nucleic acid-binding Zn-ribbon protein
MKNITLSADESLIRAARQRAVAEHTTLNEQFRIWLAEYARKQEQLRFFDETIQELRGKLKVGRKLTREEMNER